MQPGCSLRAVDIDRQRGRARSLKPRFDRGQRRTLVIQLADLGDLLLAAPAIQWLEKEGGSVTLVTKSANRELAEALVEDVIYADKHVLDRPSGLVSGRAWSESIRLVRDIRRRKADRLVLLHHLTTRFGARKWAALSLLAGSTTRTGLDNGRGWFLTEKTRDHGFGAATEEEYWVHLTGGSKPIELPRNQQRAEQLLGEARRTGYVVLAPGSGLYSLARRWPPEYFRLLAERLHDELRVELVLVGSGYEQELTASIAAGDGWIKDLAGQTDLAALVSVLEMASLYVGNDGGVSQVATRVATTPSVVLFGPTSPKSWHVSSPVSRSITLDLPCSPCMYHHYQLGEPEPCGECECLRNLSPDVVAESALDLLRSGRMRGAGA